MELTLDVHLISDRGPARERNEDRCGAFVAETAETRAERGRLFVVADGMGGHAAGDVAATLVLETLPAAYYGGAWRGAGNTLRSAISAANQVIERDAAVDPARRDMGAAVVAAALVGPCATVAHVGDARAYRVRGGIAQRLTVDHSWVQEQLDAGRITEEEARAHPYRGAMTRALSTGAYAEPDIGEWRLEPEDVLLLCSDGVCGPLSDAELAQIVETAADATQGARTLVDHAIAAGGTDNLSAIVVRVLGPQRPDSPWA